jgi:hypothetical protein
MLDANHSVIIFLGSSIKEAELLQHVHVVHGLTRGGGVESLSNVGIE